jgi:hypothetical protein
MTYLNNIKLHPHNHPCPHDKGCDVSSLRCERCEHHMRHKYVEGKTYKVWCRISPSKVPELVVPAIF